MHFHMSMDSFATAEFGKANEGSQPLSTGCDNTEMISNNLGGDCLLMKTLILHLLY